jgi:hypothetical protein
LFAVSPGASVCAKDKTATETLITRTRIFMFRRTPYKRLPEVPKYNHEIVGLANRLMAKS